MPSSFRPDSVYDLLTGHPKPDLSVSRRRLFGNEWCLVAIKFDTSLPLEFVKKAASLDATEQH